MVQNLWFLLSQSHPISTSGRSNFKARGPRPRPHQGQSRGRPGDLEQRTRKKKNTAAINAISCIMIINVYSKYHVQYHAISCGSSMYHRFDTWHLDIRDGQPEPNTWPRFGSHSDPHVFPPASESVRTRIRRLSRLSSPPGKKPFQRHTMKHQWNAVNRLPKKLYNVSTSNK